MNLYQKLLFLLSILFFAGCGSAETKDVKRNLSTDTSIYDYRDTRKLVNTIKKASLLLEQKGIQAFSDFRNTPENWGNELYYIYVYSLDGVCLYHAARPDFVGSNLIGITDLQGRKALQMAFDAVNDQANPHGWIHYIWQPRQGLHPISKSSCHFMVTMPDGRKVIVGGGLDMPPEEKLFARFAVDSAAEMLQKRGLSGLDDIRNPAARFHFRDVKVFVLREDGTALADPALDTASPRNLKEFRDVGGNYPFRTIVGRLRTENSCWVVMLDRNRYERVMGKKVIYARKTTIDGVPVIVGAMTNLPKPVWSN